MGTRTGNPTWQDSPSTATLITAARLNAIEAAIDLLPEATAPAVGDWFGSPNILSINARAWDASATSAKIFIPLQAGVTVDQLAINITTAIAASTSTISIYADTGLLRPAGSATITSGTIDCSTTGVKTVTITGTALGAPGFWCQVNPSSTSIGMQFVEVTGPGTSVSSSAGNLLDGSARNLPLGLNPGLFYWVPRVVAHRSA